MLEYKGKYGSAKVMIDKIDQATVSQIYEFLNHPAFTNPIRIMPDTHAGNGAVIGFTMPLNPDMVIPNVVGVDINCGMYFINVGRNLLSELSREVIDKRIRERIPFGTSVHKKSVIDHGLFESASIEHRLLTMKFNKTFGTSHTPVKFDMKYFENKCEDIGMDVERAINSIGTLGGGNHFIELGKSENTKDYCFTIHSGSRQFGLKICNYWQKKAGKGALAHLSGDDAFGYLTDTVLAQKYAEHNRLIMAHFLLDVCEIEWENVKETIQTNHNFIDFHDFIIRKGAISSYTGRKMVIPFNMEDGILICTGKSNPDWNYSAPHGAGRVGSRSWAKKKLNLQEAEHSMRKKGIYFSKLPHDEIKGAYKDSKIIERAIDPTATIIDRIKPILVMKD